MIWCHSFSRLFLPEKPDAQTNGQTERKKNVNVSVCGYTYVLITVVDLPAGGCVAVE